MPVKVSEVWNALHCSWNVGAGVTLLSHLQVGVTYNIAMGETGKLGGVGDVIKEFDVKNNTWQVRLGLPVLM